MGVKINRSVNTKIQLGRYLNIRNMMRVLDFVFPPCANSLNM